MKTRKLFPVATASGAAFCTLSALGYTVEICVSQGCSITREISAAGLSFYWFGLLAFAWLFICGKSPACRKVGIPSASLILLADMGLLLWQIAFLPCTNCIVVTLLFGVCAYSIIPPSGCVTFPRLRSAFTLVGSIAFILLLGGQIDPSQFGVPRENAACTVYFSPCSQQGRGAALSALAAYESVSLIPIVEIEQDVMAIADLHAKLSAGQTITEALQGPCLWEAQNLSSLRRWMIKYRSFIARVELLRIGIETIPVLISPRPGPAVWEGENRFRVSDLFLRQSQPVEK